MEEKTFTILAEQAISLDKAFILDLVARCDGSEYTCALSHTDNVCEILRLANEQFVHVTSLKGHDSTVTNVRLHQDSKNLLFSSSVDGTLKIWDFREEKCVQELSSENKPLSCMDISSNGNVLCAGTELCKGDAYLLFWDIRSHKLLGGYWESHTDDVTNVSFHPKIADTVASCSTDGLINIFDLKESSEDDALQTCLNTESSVACIRWLDDDNLAAITHTEAVQKWHTDSTKPSVVWDRELIAKSAGTDCEDCYVIDAISRQLGEMTLFASSYEGKGENVTMLETKDGDLTATNKLNGNKQIVRCCCHLNEHDWLLTAGEGGHLTVWQLSSDAATSTRHKEKKTQSKKYKPY